jgi:acetamidase/formamidase
MTFARASIVGAAIAAMAVGPQVTHVPSRPETTVWGEFPIDRTPVVTVKPGDVVQIDTLSHQGATQDDHPVTYLGEAVDLTQVVVGKIPKRVFRSASRK